MAFSQCECLCYAAVEKDKTGLSLEEDFCKVSVHRIGIGLASQCLGCRKRILG